MKVADEINSSVGNHFTPLTKIKEVAVGDIDISKEIF